MKQLVILLFFTGLLVAFLSCKCEDKSKNPDLLIPKFVNANMPITHEYSPCYIGNIYYPYGSDVFLIAGSFNEFYSLRRYDSINYNYLVFYWNCQNLTAFDPYSTNPVLWPPQPGESIGLHRCVFNVDNSFDNCYTKTAEASKTRITTGVRVENGVITETISDEKVSTPAIPPGGYSVVSTNVEYAGNGFYQVSFETDVEEDIDEYDEGNNVYIERGTNNMTSAVK